MPFPSTDRGWNSTGDTSRAANLIALGVSNYISHAIGPGFLTGMSEAAGPNGWTELQLHVRQMNTLLEQIDVSSV